MDVRQSVAEASESATNTFPRGEILVTDEDLSAIQIIETLRNRHSDVYPRAADRESFIREVPPMEIALLACVKRYGHWWNETFGGINGRLVTGFERSVVILGISEGELERLLGSLASKGFLQASGGLFKKRRLYWGKDSHCYAYLNDWGWDALLAALEHRRKLGEGGPPYLGGPGMSGYSEADI